MNVAIVGAGLIGKKRAASLKKNDRLLIVCDINEIIAKKSAHEFSLLHKIEISKAHWQDQIIPLNGLKHISRFKGC